MGQFRSDWIYVRSESPNKSVLPEAEAKSESNTYNWIRI